MEIVTLLIHQNIIMVVYMACGYFCIKRKLLQKPEAVISEKCCFIL